MQRQPHMCMEAIACWISAKPQCLGRAIGDWCFSDISLINPKNVYVVSHATLPSETEMRPAVQCEPWTRIWMHHFHWVACQQGIVALLSFQYPALLFSIGSSSLFPSRAGSNKKPIRFVSLHWGMFVSGSCMALPSRKKQFMEFQGSWNPAAFRKQLHLVRGICSTSWPIWVCHCAPPEPSLTNHRPFSHLQCFNSHQKRCTPH